MTDLGRSGITASGNTNVVQPRSAGIFEDVCSSGLGSIVSLCSGSLQENQFLVLVDRADADSFYVNELVNVSKWAIGIAILDDKSSFNQTDTIEALGYFLNRGSIDVHWFRGPGQGCQHAGGE